MMKAHDLIAFSSSGVRSSFDLDFDLVVDIVVATEVVLEVDVRGVPLPMPFNDDSSSSSSPPPLPNSSCSHPSTPSVRY
jgi:hypothetical protein